MIIIALALFHGTLLFTCQLGDELPMLWLVLVTLYCLIEDKPTNQYPWLAYVMAAFGGIWYAPKTFQLLAFFHLSLLDASSPSHSHPQDTAFAVVLYPSFYICSCSNDAYGYPYRLSTRSHRHYPLAFEVVFISLEGVCAYLIVPKIRNTKSQTTKHLFYYGFVGSFIAGMSGNAFQR